MTVASPRNIDGNTKGSRRPAAGMLKRIGMIAALGLAVTATSACKPLQSHQGYIIDVDLVNSVQPGVDNRQSVLKTLGKPSFTGQFADGDWYYIARDSRNFAYNKPKAAAQQTLRISFDPRGVVTAINRTGIEKVASVDPYGKKTPTLGKKRSFFDELFGNIGQVGSLAGQPGGGNRDQP